MTRSSARVIVYQRPGETAFLNVDVDVRSRVALDTLVQALGKSVSIHYLGRHHGSYWAHFALYSPKSLELAVRGLARVVRRLPSSARRLWDGARDRVFDIGIQAGWKPHASEHVMSIEAVEELARLGVSVKLTVYASERPVRTSPRKA